MTVPAEIVGKAGLRSGTRLDWRLTERADVLEVHVLPDLPTLAAGLHGHGKMPRGMGGSPINQLHREREADERGRELAFDRISSPPRS